MDRSSVKNILKFLALVGLLNNLFFLIPVTTGVIYHENIDGFIFFTIVTTLLFGLILYWLKNHKIEMKIKEAILSVNLVWLMVSVLAAIPMIMMTHISFIDAFFESVSGFTTTGATIYPEVSNLPKTVLMLRSTTNFFGGMGIIVLGIGLLSIINPTGTLALFKSESTGITPDKITPKIKHTALILWIVYFCMIVANIVLFKLEGMNWFDAINQAFACVATGGFSTKDNSFGYWINNPWILWTAIFFMFISGMNFIAHIKLIKGDFSGYKSEEVKWYVIIFLVFSLALSLVHYFHSNNTFFFSLTNGFFTITSILTCTGFATVNYDTWTHLAQALILVTMLFGGNAGSTAGGIKTIRFVVMFKNLKYQIQKILYPNAILSIKIDKKTVSRYVVNNVSAFIFLYILTVTVISLILFAGGHDALTSLSATLECVGNIGVGLQHVGPVYNFSGFSGFDKVVLAIGMIIGRLECYTVLILLTRQFWKKF
ncbi:potassium transporter [Nautilia sp. PV-1]|uniref:TrkH family potassium uptake protein n=1 Tax=Nautilia sp. PV-1 TaxID=2579250 RepID=UPI000FDA3DBE|nr:TrkH family potassium uptake protein [Nautilia sp. PV-1]AZV45931.1 potassium transporter [Nautilia sp. PV-1]